MWSKSIVLDDRHLIKTNGKKYMYCIKIILAYFGSKSYLTNQLTCMSSQTSGKSLRTSDISFPRSPQPTYTITSELENLDKLCEITVFPHPKAPGMAVVPPKTQLEKQTEKNDVQRGKKW